jgi:dGTPase
MGAIMNWTSLLTDKRFRSPREDDSQRDDGRSPFQKDIDRITFSSAFRRLGRKTQVHLLSKNDHVHTRLSHSLEVSCVGRSLGVRVGKWLDREHKEELPEGFLPSAIGEIVQGACLAHDIGNPPFGHAAEDAIRRWFQENLDIDARDRNKGLSQAQRLDLERFDGNAMGFRTVTHREYFEGGGGMRLTYATLGTLLKYPWTSHFAEPKPKFGSFQTEYESLREIAAELGLIEKIHDRSESKAEYARHPLAYLVEAADDICYQILDIEDAIELNLLRPEYLKSQFAEAIRTELTRDQQSLLENKSVSWRIKNGLLRGKMVGRMVGDVVNVFKTHYSEIMEGTFQKSLVSATADNCLCSRLDALYSDKEERLADWIYRNDRNVPLELGVYSVFRTLLEASREAAYEIVARGHLSYKTEIIRKFIRQDAEDRFKDKDLYGVIMLFLDYITGMTDDYATYVNKQLLGTSA